MIMLHGHYINGIIVLEEMYLFRVVSFVLHVTYWVAEKACKKKYENDYSLHGLDVWKRRKNR